MSDRTEAAPAAETPAPAKPRKKVVPVYLPYDKWRALRILAAETDRTLEGILREGLEIMLADARGAA